MSLLSLIAVRHKTIRVFGSQITNGLQSSIVCPKLSTTFSVVSFRRDMSSITLEPLRVSEAYGRIDKENKILRSIKAVASSTKDAQKERYFNRVIQQNNDRALVSCFEDAIEIFGVAPQSIIRELLITGIYRRDIVLVNRVWDYAQSHGYADRTIYSMMINSLTINGDIKRALSLLAQMKLDGIKPDLKTYTNLVRVSAAAPDLERLVKLSQELAELDPEEPSERVLFSLPALINQGMKRRNLPFDYESKILSLAKEGDTSPVVYNLLMYIALDRREYNRVIELFEATRKRGVAVNSSSYGPLLEAYGALGKKEAMFNLFLELQRKNYKIGSVGYLAVCKQANKDNISKIVEIYEVMKGKGADVIYPAHYLLFDFAIEHGIENMIFSIWDGAVANGNHFNYNRTSKYRDYLTKSIESTTLPRRLEFLNEKLYYLNKK